MNILRLVANPSDSMAFESALQCPLVSESLSNVEIENRLLPQIRSHAEGREIPLLEAARECILKGILDSRYVSPLTTFIQHIDSWRSVYLRIGSKGSTVVADILREAASNYRSADVDRVIDIVAKRVSSFDSLTHFFDTSLQEDMLNLSPLDGGDCRGRLLLMTMQAAKGLEFNEVFLPFWVAGRLPRKVQDADNDRRLAFVSLTRARSRVHISYAISRVDATTGTALRLERSPFVTDLLQTDSPSISFSRYSLLKSAGYIGGIGVTKFNDETAFSGATNCNLGSSKKKKRAAARSPSSFVGSEEGDSGNTIDLGLLSPDSLRVEDVADLLNSKILRKDLKALFREALRIRNFSRGTIPVWTSEDRSIAPKKRAFSACTAKQLGDFLVEILRNGEGRKLR